MRNHAWGAPDREDHQLTVRICDHCKTRMLTDKSRASEGIYVTRYASAQGMPYHGKGRPPCISAPRVNDMPLSSMAVL
jgi:hypothetical protein